MTNEIKEILDYLKDKKGYSINEFGFHKELTPEENNKLLDYITNLQEENFNLRENILIHKMSFKSDDKSLEHLINMPSYEELQQENERLKQDYAKIVSSNCDYLKLEQENERLNKIIDELEKDLEYKIKEFEKDGYDLPSVRQQSLWLAGCYDEDKLILQELKELKEGGKNNVKKEEN